MLDDGVLDLRMITADEPFARLRLLWAVLTGTVATSRITHLSEAGPDPGGTRRPPMVLAVDGEVMPGVRGAEFTVQRGALHVLLAAGRAADGRPLVPPDHPPDYPDSPLNHP